MVQIASKSEFISAESAENGLQEFRESCNLQTGLTSPFGCAKIGFSPKDLDMLKVSLPDAADQDTAFLRSQIITVHGY